MLIQRAGCGTLPPPGFSLPPWEDLARQWASTPPPTMPRPTLGPTTVALGHNDSEADDSVFPDQVQGHTFGWDNESPMRCVQVGAFKAEWRPVSNGEFKAYLDGAGPEKVNVPKSWVVDNGETQVCAIHRGAYMPYLIFNDSGANTLRPRSLPCRRTLASPNLL